MKKLLTNKTFWIVVVLGIFIAYLVIQSDQWQKNYQ